MPCLTPIKLSPHVVPCGQCEGCLVQRRNDWSFRIREELKVSKNARFVTLTYAPGNEPYTRHYFYDQDQVYSYIDVETVNKRDPQLFLKKLREHAREAQKTLKWPGIRYYLVSEYGSETQRPHYHLILFNCPTTTLDQIEEIWTHGFTHIGEANDASIHYTTKYVINSKSNENAGRMPPFALMSRRPGIGSGYINRAKKWHIQNNYTYGIGTKGQKIPLPRYYKDRIFPKFIRQRNSYQALQKAITKDREGFELAISNNQNPWYLSTIRRDNYKRKIRNTDKNSRL